MKDTKNNAIDSAYIVINDIAASFGGALTILNSILFSVKQCKDKSVRWILFVSNESIESSLTGYENIEIIIVPKGNQLFRIYWDLFGLRKWLKKHRIIPRLIISLQNTGMPFIKAPQIVYIHQAIPFNKCNIFTYGPRYYFFKYLYLVSLVMTIKKSTYIICQTGHMKHSILKAFNHPKDKIYVVKPTIKIETEELQKEHFYNFPSYTLFYPSYPYPYKNHILLLKAIRIILKKNPELYNKLNLIFTFDEKMIQKTIKNYDFYRSKRVSYSGYLSREDIFHFYRKADIIVYPSLVESYALPLMEGSFFNKRIFSIDKEYSREVLCDYYDVTFIQNEPELWAEEIIKNYSGNTERKNGKKEIYINKEQKENEYQFLQVIDTVIKKDGF